jgi:hypothetical protein
MHAPLPAHAGNVILGHGSIGCNLAFHLASSPRAISFCLHATR